MADDVKKQGDSTSGLMSAIGGIAGGLIGNQASASDRNAANAEAQQTLQALLKIGYPPETAQALVLQQYHSSGLLTPELEQSIMAGPSATAGITEDPALKNRQMSALNLIAQRAQGGLNQEDRAKFNQIRTDLAKEQQAKQQQIIQQAQMRGMGGSGAELAAALQEQQAGANQASQQGDQLAATASQNALQAALQSGQLGGQIRQQDFNVNQARTSAADEMNRFNVSNRMNQQARNVQAQNQAQQYNLGNNQGISNANVGQANQETARQNQAKYTDWSNKAGYITNQLGPAYAADAARQAARAKGTSDMWGSIGGVAGTAIGTLYGGPAGGAVGGQVGSQLGGAISASNGGVVPGKAKYSGNHPENDTVPALLSPGEIIIPKHIADSEDAPLHAANYIAYLKGLKEKGGK
jgi:hypothetical protein